MYRIKEILKEQGRSQVWLANKIGMKYHALYSRINNKTKLELDIAVKIAEALNVNLTDLLK